MKADLQEQIEELLNSYLDEHMEYFPVEAVARKITELAFEYYREDLGR